VKISARRGNKRIQKGPDGGGLRHGDFVQCIRIRQLPRYSGETFARSNRQDRSCFDTSIACAYCVVTVEC
jgi:hypothetical protein